MENLEGKTLKELYAIRDKRRAHRFEEYQKALDRFRNEKKGKGARSIYPPNSPDDFSDHIYFGETQGWFDEFNQKWHKDDRDIYAAVRKVRKQESDAQDIRNIQEILGKSPNRNKANEPKVPLVVWVGVVLLIAFIATKVF